MVDMPDYAHPYQPNIFSNTMAVNSLQGLIDSQQLSNDQRSAGQIAASGDYDAASKQLMSQGHMAEALQMQKVMRQAKEDKLSDLNATYSKLGDAAQLADTPEKWSQLLTSMQQHGIPTAGYEDFNTGRQTALALSGKVKEFGDAEKARRDAEIARLKGSTTYKTTIPGEDGGDELPATQMRTPQGDWTPPVATPKGVDIDDPLSTGKEVASQKLPHEIQADYKEKYGGVLPISLAIKAQKLGVQPIQDANGDPQVEDKPTNLQLNAKSYQKGWAEDHPNGRPLSWLEAMRAASIAERNQGGTSIGFEIDDKGEPRLKTGGLEGAASYGRTPEGKYNLSASNEAAKSDIGVQARNRLGTVVQQHSQMLDNISKSPDFNKAMEFLHTPDGVRFWSGEAVDLGKVPQTAIDLRMTIKSLQHEYGNFVAAGHKGAMSEHEGADLQNIVGQLNLAPDANTFRHGVGTLRDLAGAFQKVQMLGPQGAKSSAPAAGGASKAPHEMTDDELKKQLGL